MVALAIGCGGGDGGPVDAGPPELTISPETGALRCEAQSEIDCAIDVGERLPLEVTGTTGGRDDGYGGASCGLGGDAVEDIAFRWTPPTDGTYRISTEGSAFDTFLSVRSGSCAGREVACNDDATEGASHSSLLLDLTACRTVTIVVDGATVDVGPFRLTVHGTETACDDGADDDGDGAVDCDDEDCFGRVCPGEDRWPVDWADAEWEVLELVNAERAAGATCGGEPHPPAPALEMNLQLRDAARFHSQDMSDNRYFSHDSLDGRTVADRVAEAGFTGSGPIGENIAEAASAAEAVAAWMGSPGHCANIMNPAFHVIGVGYALGDGGPRWTQDFGGSH